MKKIHTLLFLSALLIFPLSLPAREIVKLTRFSGRDISGISAAHMFKVELVKSNDTKAIVEIDSELEPYLQLDLKSSGVLSVDLNIPKSEKERFEKNPGWKKRTQKLTVYLPELRYVKLESMVQLTSEDTFSGQSVEIKLEDMAKIKLLRLTAHEVRIKAESMTNATFALQTQTTSVTAENMANITLTGETQTANVTSTDMGKVNGSAFKVERATLKATNMGKISIHANQYLYARSSDMGSINYTGNPAEVDLKTPKRTVKTTK